VLFDVVPCRTAAYNQSARIGRPPEDNLPELLPSIIFSGSATGKRMSEKITIYKAAFDFQIRLLLEHSVEKIRMLYESEGIAKEDMQVFVDDCIAELQQAIKVERLDPADSNNHTMTEHIDTVTLFKKMAYQEFEKKKDNLRELCFFRMLAYIALYKHHMLCKNYYDALTCISYANIELSRQGYGDFAGKTALAERAANSGRQKGLSQKEQTISYMKESLISRQWETRDNFFHTIADEIKKKFEIQRTAESIKKYFYKELSEAEKNIFKRRSKTIMGKS
jgi:hypothetical protein